LRSAVAEQKALAVIAASRPSTEAMVFRESLARELGDDRVTTVELNPLDKEDGLQLIRQLAPHLSQDEAVELWSQAKGSPFWLGGQRGPGAQVRPRPDTRVGYRRDASNPTSRAAFRARQLVRTAGGG